MKNPNELMLLLKSVTRSLTIEVKILNASATKFVIPRQSKLDNSLITGVTSFDISNASESILSGLPNVAAAVYNKAYLTMEDSDSNAFIERIPLSSFNKIVNAGERYMTNYQIVNFENSFIEVASNTGLVKDTVFILTVDYIYLKDLKRLGIDPDELLKRFMNP